MKPIAPSRGFDRESGAVDLAERIAAGARDVRAIWYVRRGHLVDRAEREAEQRRDEREGSVAR